MVYCSSFGLADSDRPIASEATGIKALSATPTATAAVRVDGQVVTWGANDYEQLGHDLPSATCASIEDADRPSVRALPGLTDVVAIDGGSFFFLARKTDGTVVAWGLNQDGQLGNDTTTTSGVPTTVVGLTGVTQIAAGATHSLAAKSDGTLWAWGSNGFGQLGITGGTQTTPVLVSGVNAPVAIAAGFHTSFAVLADGSVWTWGAIPAGLIDGAPTAATTPRQIASLSAIAAIATASTTTYALGQDGRVWAWGSNTFGQLGDGTTTSRNTPGLVVELPAIRTIATSGEHALAVAADGSVWAWGRNAAGQVGDLTGGTDRLTPMVVAQAATLTPVTMTTPGTLNPALDRVSYYHTDAIGSVRVITDAAGEVVQRFDYKPFGEEWTTPTNQEALRFTGQERDQETGGLYYLGARHYRSDIGRFMRPDDPGFADLFDPQSMNLYAYAYNNPSRYVDLTGHAGDCVGGYDPETGLCKREQFDRTFLEFLWREWVQPFGTMAEQVGDATSRFVTTPRDPGCMANWIGAGAARGLAVGTVLGAASGGFGIVVTAPGAIVVNVAGGAAAGSVACMASANGGGGGGGRPGVPEGMTADQIISQFKKGSIRDVFPGQHLNKTLSQIRELAARGDATARTALKLLTNNRFNK